MVVLTHHEGKHVVSGSPTLLTRLSTATELPEDVRGAFRQIKLRNHEAASVRASVSHLVEIEPREGDIVEVDDGMQRRFQVPLSYFRAYPARTR